MPENFYVHCAGCGGYYPADESNVAVGRPHSEAKNLARVHRQANGVAHQTTLVPEHLMERSPDNVERKVPE